MAKGWFISLQRTDTKKRLKHQYGPYDTRQEAESAVGRIKKRWDTVPVRYEIQEKEYKSSSE